MRYDKKDYADTLIANAAKNSGRKNPRIGTTTGTGNKQVNVMQDDSDTIGIKRSRAGKAWSGTK